MLQDDAAALELAAAEMAKAAAHLVSLERQIISTGGTEVPNNSLLPYAGMQSCCSFAYMYDAIDEECVGFALSEASFANLSPSMSPVIR